MFAKYIILRHKQVINYSFNQFNFKLRNYSSICQNCNGAIFNQNFEKCLKTRNFERIISSRFLSSNISDSDSPSKLEKTKDEKVKVKLKMSEFKRLLSLAEPEKWTLSAAIGLLIISSSVTMAIPFSLGKVLDIIYSNSQDFGSAKEKLDSLCLMLCGVFLLGGVCNFGRVYLMSISGQRMTNALRKKVFSSIVRQETAWFSTTASGELINRLSADSQLVGRNLSQNVSDGLRSTFMVGAGTGMMLYMSPSLALVGLCVVPPVAGLAVIYGRFVRNITRQLQDRLADSTKFAEERISNIKTVKAFSQEERECNGYAERINLVLDLAKRESLALGSFYGMTGLAGNTIIILVLYYGGTMVSMNELTVGNLTSFLLYAAYVGISISGLSSFYTELNKGIGAATRLWEIIDRKPTIPVIGGLQPIGKPKGEITLENVSFSYTDAPLLRNINLTIEPGSSLALVGRSGCGKSTVASLLLRLYDPIEGRILLDGVDIRDLDPVWLRSHVGFVSQEPVLFAGTIRENIMYGATGQEEIDEQAYQEACRAAQLEGIEAWGAVDSTGGESREVGARGGALSGGQKQRVAIARAIIKKPKILILDEATSALDAYSEYLVDKALKEISKDRTVITIAHRLSTIKNANEVAVIEDGTIVERGPYEELVSKEDSAFKNLVLHQSFARSSS